MDCVKLKKISGLTGAILIVALAAIVLSGCQRTFIISRIILSNLTYQLTHSVKPAAGKIQVEHQESEVISVSWIGHATTLINLYGSLILTDPNFSNRLGWINRRLVAPGLKPSELPPLDLVIISHAHLDHFDLPSLRALPRETTLVIPTNTTDLLHGLGFHQLIEIGWGKEISVKGVTIKAFQPAHWGKRSPFDDSERGYNSYILTKQGKSILFAGDTAYTEVIGKEGKKYQLAFAILPIGAYQPELWHRRHANPEEALRMSLEAGAQYMVPIHWGTFILSLEPINEPIQRLRAEVGRLGALDNHVFFLRPGETAVYPVTGAPEDRHLPF